MTPYGHLNHFYQRLQARPEGRTIIGVVLAGAAVAIHQKVVGIHARR
jgi:hypothetical protein